MSSSISSSRGVVGFVRRAVGLSVAVIVLPLAAYLGLPVDRYAYMGALKDKEQLLEFSDSPRLLVVGGSSSAFGIDSARIEGALEDRYQVVNTGLHGGLGLRFILAFAEAHLRPGDVVVLAPEYSLLLGLHDNSSALHEALGEYWGAWRYASLRDDPIEAAEFFRAVQKRFRRLAGLAPTVDHPYLTRQGFNDRGDLVSHLRLPSPGMRFRVTFDFRPPPPGVVQEIRDFHESCRRAGARLFVTFGPYPRSLMTGDSSSDGWLGRLRDETGVEVISRPEDYLLPDEMFFDTANHLNAEGRDLRTTRLIEDLRPALEAEESEGPSE